MGRALSAVVNISGFFARARVGACWPILGEGEANRPRVEGRHNAVQKLEQAHECSGGEEVYIGG